MGNKLDHVHHHSDLLQYRRYDSKTRHQRVLLSMPDYNNLSLSRLFTGSLASDVDFVYHNPDLLLDLQLFQTTKYRLSRKITSQKRASQTTCSFLFTLRFLPLLRFQPLLLLHFQLLPLPMRQYPRDLPQPVFQPLRSLHLPRVLHGRRLQLCCLRQDA